MKTIAVVNPKGGSGKSTVATSIAAYYSGWEGNVLLADFDVQQSSLEWLRRRPKHLPRIRGFSSHKHNTIPRAADYAIIDVPSGIHGEQLTYTLEQADKLVIPVLPSPFDIRAVEQFVYLLLTTDNLPLKPEQMCIIANRVKQQTLSFRKLQQFLGELKIPFITSLRDSQNYVRAAEFGRGILELPSKMIEKDIQQWGPLLRWLDGTD